VTKGEIDNLDFITTKNFWASKNILMKVKKTLQKWGKMYANHIRHLYQKYVKK
jgi:hypothetical protein